MTVTTEGAASGSPAVRASGRGSPRAGTVEQLSRADRVAQGKDARAVTPLESHAEFAPAGPRDPVGLLLEQAKSRVPELVPVRHGRTLVSPFTFYRGAALPMAADLAGTPASGLRVELCGDAHLSNFGAFASPEHNLVFDVNDFDETLPGPFEWDVKRLAASLAVAGRDNGFPRQDPPQDRPSGGRGVPDGDERLRRAAVPGRLVRTPRHRAGHQQVPVPDEGEEVQGRREAADQGPHPRRHEGAGQAHHPGRGRRRIVSDPPMIVPLEELFTDVQAGALYEEIRTVLGKYRRTLQSGLRHLLEQFTLVQAAR